MKRRLLAALGAALVAGAVQAQEPLPPPTPTPPPSPPLCPNACPKVYVVPVESATTLPTLKSRMIDAGKETCPGLKLDWKDSVCVEPTLELKPRTVEQQVTCLVTKAETVTDPLTGKTCTVFKLVEEVQTVKITVWDLVPAEQKFNLKTAVLVPADREFLLKKVVLDAGTQPAVERRYQLVTPPGAVVTPAGCAK